MINSDALPTGTGMVQHTMTTSGHLEHSIEGKDTSHFKPETLVERYVDGLSALSESDEELIYYPPEQYSRGRSDSRGSEDFYSSDWDDGEDSRQDPEYDYDGWPIEEMIRLDPMFSQDNENDASQVFANLTSMVPLAITLQSVQNPRPREEDTADTLRFSRITDHPQPKSFYAVARGFRVGIYMHKEEARQQLHGFAGGKSMVFRIEAEALLYLEKWR